jgi:hypothetical protein
MARTRKDEDRLLSQDERDAVARTHVPGLKELADGELSELIRRLRERRDRARALAHRQRRELRRKVEPKGVRPAADDRGARGKDELLTAALKRASKEATRRRGRERRSDQAAIARRALRRKRAAGAEPAPRPTSATPGEGMRALPNERIAPSGALGAEGDRPVLERSRKVR